MNSFFASFCLKYETTLIKSKVKKDLVIDFKKSIINLPRLSSDGILNVIILSDGSTSYLPCSVYSVPKKFNNNNIKFLSSKSDLFSSLSST